MRRRIIVLLVTFAACQADDRKPVFPQADWERIAKPESVQFSSAKLEVLRAWLKTLHTTSMMVSVGGRVLFEYGDVTHVSKVASVRKSILGMLYGRYVGNGTIDLDKTVVQAGLADVQKFLPIEEHATLEHLLMARSGIYHPAGDGDDPEGACPQRGSQLPSTFFCYQNWDFNAAGAAFEKLTGKNIYDALQSDLAVPIGMQDFDRKLQKKIPVMPQSVHPEYAMYLSTRDMARLGLLMLRRGNWNGQQIMDPNWVKYMTTLVTPAKDLFPRSISLGNQLGPERWGFGVMWWVWDAPRFPGHIAIGAFYGAYCAMGTGGQYITVLPKLDMVIAHKVELQRAPGIEIGPEGYVSDDEYLAGLQLLAAGW